MKLNNILSFGFSKKHLFLRIADTNLINLGRTLSISDRFFLFQITVPGEQTKIPFVGLHFFGKTYEIGKRVGWSEEFEISNVRPIDGNPRFPLVIDGYSGEYSVGKATYTYGDKSTSEKEVFFIHSLIDKRTNIDICLPIMYCPIYRNDGTKNLRPEPVLRKLLGLSESIRNHIEETKGSLLP